MGNLLDKSSILLTPTAYNNGKILSVKPNTSVGDFDFTRNSSATRVNSQGLIEDVQILSGDLVTNGDFSQEGSELVLNPNFNSNSWWGLDANWSILNGAANSNGTGTIYKGGVVTIGKTYKVVVSVSSYTSGNLTYPNASNYNIPSAVGVYTFYYVANSQTISFTGNSYIGSIDNVSVKEVGQNWNLGTGWGIGEGKAVANNVPNGQRLQTSTTASVVGNTYKYSLNISNISGAYTLYVFGVNALVSVSTEGIVEGYVTATSTNGAVYISGATVGGLVSADISNISVIEITDDTNLPRIDYTGGEGHWLFEPQSTNLYLYSEPRGNESSVANVSYENFNWAIGFTNCVKYGDNSVLRYRYGGTVSASTEYTLSAFIIMDDLSEPIIGGQTSGNDFTFVLGGAVYSNANSSINMGNNIWRVSVTGTTSALPSIANNGIIKYTAQSSKGFRVVGLQLEENSFATSYIPTNGAISTRLQDVANGAGSSDLINSTEGVLYFEGSALANDLTNRTIGILGDSNNLIELAYRNNTNQIRCLIKSSGVVEVNIQHTLSDITLNNKFAIKYKSNNVSLYVNGFEVATDLSANMPSGLNELNFNRFDDAENFYGKTKCVAVFKEALTDAELTCLTTI